MSLAILPFEAIGAERWDAFLATSPEAWFYHSTEWFEYVREYMGARQRTLCAFGIAEGGELLALCPVAVETCNLAPETWQLTLSGEFQLAPALAPGLTDKQRQRVYDAYVTELARLAAEHGAAYTQVAVPVPIDGYLAASMPVLHPLRRYGFTDLPYMSQVIDLAQDEAVLWQGLRKGHKADVNRARRDCEIRHRDAATITPAKCRQYQELHAKDAGRVTRSSRTFDLMMGWVAAGHGVLAEAVCDGQPVGFSLFIIYNRGAYYGSSCKDPDRAEIPASHLIQWETIRWLKARGVRWYDLGRQQFGPQWHEVPSVKAIAIAAFKRGFGGTTVPSLIAEQFYSLALQREVYARRLREWTTALEAEPAP